MLDQLLRWITSLFQKERTKETANKIISEKYISQFEKWAISATKTGSKIKKKNTLNCWTIEVSDFIEAYNLFTTFPSVSMYKSQHSAGITRCVCGLNSSFILELNDKTKRKSNEIAVFRLLEKQTRIVFVKIVFTKHKKKLL